MKYSPLIIKLPFCLSSPVLAVGGHSKLSLGLAKGRQIALLTGNEELNSPGQYRRLKTAAMDLLKNTNRALICHDLHENYISTKLARQINEKDPKKFSLLGVQHHHAHIAAGLFDNRISSDAVCAVFDGTGAGTDKSIWGGDFFIASPKKAIRIGRLKYVDLIGGEAAIREPWLITLAWLKQIFPGSFLKLPIDFIKSLDKQKLKLALKISGLGFNCIKTSSMGRLFDAASALLMLVKGRIAFEAEGPIKLEQLAQGFSARGNEKPYEFAIKKQEKMFVADPSFIIKGMVEDLKKKQSHERIAFRFHVSVAWLCRQMIKKISKAAKTKKVLLCGGVFQNRILTDLTLAGLKKDGFNVYGRNQIPITDAALAIGQLMVALNKAKLEA